MMENIRIYLLGTFRFYRNGLLLSAKDWHVRQARQLFKLLFTEREHTVPADKVIDLLWPYSAENAHKTLRSAVSILRTVLEPEREPQAPSLFVPRGSTGYTLHLPNDASIWVDIREFERNLDAASDGYENPRRRRLLEAALQLYSGDYLAEDEQESWTFAERTRLRERYFDAALSLMEMQRKQHLYSEAIAVGRRALSFDTCREPFYPAIMYCQAAIGDTVGALQTFEQCRQELHHRLGVYPAPQTLELHTELLQGKFYVEETKQVPAKYSSPSKFAPSKPIAIMQSKALSTSEAEIFASRREIWSTLTHSIDTLCEQPLQLQHTRSMVIAGEVGTGKSFLLRAILDYTHPLPITTMTASCQVIEQEIVFTPLLQVIKSWLAKLLDDELLQLPQATLGVLSHFMPELLVRLPHLTPTPFLNAEQAQSVFITGFVDIFLALSQQHPLIIALDDVQWIDEASLHVLHRLSLANRQNSALLLLLFYRPEDISENEVLQTTLFSLGCCNTFNTIQISNLSVEDVRMFLHQHAAVAHIPTEQCYAATHGNPLLLTEIAQLYSGRSRYLPHSTDLINVLLQSQKLHDLFLARVARLPPRALELLELAAVISDLFPPGLFSSPLCVEDCKMLDILLARHFLQTLEPKEYDVCLAFTHEIFAKIVYANCSALKRSQLHLQVAERMVCYYAETLNSHAEAIAFHYRHAGPQYQQCVDQYELAAKRA